MISMRMDASLYPQHNHGIMDEESDHDSVSSSSSSDASIDSMASSSSDFAEDATSSTASSSASSTSDQLSEDGPLYQMSSLIEQLPFKRGLSKHFQGKSQSFTSLSNVRSLEDLAKPDYPYKKRLKTCKSYGGLDGHKSYSHKTITRTISKKGPRGSCSPFNAKRNSFMTSRPPIPPQRLSELSNQTPLIA